MRRGSSCCSQTLTDNVGRHQKVTDKRLRLARSLTQQGLANRSELGKTYVCNVEQGSVDLTLASMEAFAEGLQCSLVDILLVPPPNEPRKDYGTADRTGSQLRSA
jgi:transcriptional regulator with XRE-family HTH domain